MLAEERINDIEIKLARQEDLVDTLNQLVYRQQKKLGELEALCAALARHIKAASSAADDNGEGDDRPPHY